MKTIEERTLEYFGKPEEMDDAATTRARKAYIASAREQKLLTIEAFDEWLCRNSWITRDEDNRKPLEELRNIIQNI